MAVTWVRLHPGQTSYGRASLLVAMGQNRGGLFVLDVDPSPLAGLNATLAVLSKVVASRYPSPAAREGLPPGAPLGPCR